MTRLASARDPRDRRYLSTEVIAFRIAVARWMASHDGNFHDVARVLRVSVALVWYFCRRYDPETFERLRAGHRHGFRRADALRRLRVVKGLRWFGHNTSEIARILGMSAPGLLMWLKRWAPDGLDQAIEDLCDVEEFAEAA